MKRGRAFVEALVTFIMMVAVVGFLWSLIGKPMMRNYDKCGTIFLCVPPEDKT